MHVLLRPFFRIDTRRSGLPSGGVETMLACSMHALGLRRCLPALSPSMIEIRLVTDTNGILRKSASP